MPHRPTTARRLTAAVLIAIGTAAAGAAAEPGWRVLAPNANQSRQPSAGAGMTLELRFLDEAWNGEAVPEGSQCQKFGGEAGSPAMHVAGIPEQANALIIEFSDRDFAPMDNGGHGKFGLEIEPGTASIDIGSVPGHTTDLPAGFFVVEEHKAPTWDKAGAYLPPCSGGRGNSYYLTVRAVHRMGEETHELASGTLEMGKY